MVSIGRGEASLFASSSKKRRLARKSLAFVIVEGSLLDGVSLDDVSSNRVPFNSGSSAGRAVSGVEVAPKVGVASLGEISGAKAVCLEATSDEGGSEAETASNEAVLSEAGNSDPDSAVSSS